MKITLDLDLGPLKQTIDLHRRKVQGAAYRTLNATAEQARDDIRQEMRRVFDRPTPYTLNSLRITKYARRDDLEAEVGFKDRLATAKANSPEKWVRIQVTGGARPQKRSERRISYRRGNQALYIVPTQFAPLDTYGNVSRGFIVKVLSQIEALDEGNNRSRTRKSRGRRRAEEYFAVYQNKPGLKPGIYRRMRTGFGSGVVPMFFFSRNAPTYTQRLDFDGTAQKSVRANLDRIWAQIWATQLER